jgi:protein translocase SecG subunit
MAELFLTPQPLVCRTQHFLLPCSAMEFIQSVVLPVLPYVQIVLSVLLIAAVLLQQRGSSLGGAFGGDNFSSTFHKRRGSELFLFRATAVIAVLFVLSTLVSVIF